MSNNKQKVVVLCVPGRFQNYLLHCLQHDHDLVGVVFQQSERPYQTKLRRLNNILRYLFKPARALRHLYARIALPKYEKRAEQRLQTEFADYAEWQDQPDNLNFITVNSINDLQVIEFIDGLKPDIVCVNGTQLIREPLLSKVDALPFGMINLHTGLSPYSRGGNCNLYMLLENKPQWVGGTVHYIDKGIDSGDIIHSYQVEMFADDSYESIDGRVFLTGMHALSDAIIQIANGQAHGVMVNCFY